MRNRQRERSCGLLSPIGYGTPACAGVEPNGRALATGPFHVERARQSGLQEREVPFESPGIRLSCTQMLVKPTALPA